MSRSTTLRASIAALAILPAFTACSMLPSTGKINATPSQNHAAPQDSGVDPSAKDSQKTDDNQDQSPEPSDEPTGGDEQGTADSSQDSGNDSSDDAATASDDDAAGTDDSSQVGSAGGSSSDDASNTGTSDSNATDSTEDAASDSSTANNSTADQSTAGSDSGSTQRVSVPAGSGISQLDLVKIYGSPASGGAHGRIVAVFKATTDRPMMLNLRIKLYDAAGKQIATNTGLNSVYTTGSQYLVTSNLIELPAGAKPVSFKASLVDKTDMGPEFSIAKVSKPRLGTSAKFSNVQVLRGTATLRGAMKGTVEANAACIMPNGKVYHGSESLNDNPVKGGQVDYEVPMYDAKGADLSQARCYVSA